MKELVIDTRNLQQKYVADTMELPAGQPLNDSTSSCKQRNNCALMYHS